MAQFYAEIKGNRGKATRMGTKESGITGHIRGWHVGVKVVCEQVKGKDIIRVYRTNGSSDPSSKLVAIFHEDGWNRLLKG